MCDHLRKVALGQEPADILIKNGQLVNVLAQEIYPADIVIAGEQIAGIGHYTEGIRVIDAQGKYILPGFINTHCHVESSMAAPAYYCAEELRWGVTTLVTDPHEIANVAGLPGIRYMLQATEQLPVNYFVQLPSCVPATPFEHAGSILDAEALGTLVGTPGVWGLGEVMNVPGILQGDGDLLAKLHLPGLHNVDGHAPGVSGRALNAYIAHGINTDHESVTWAEAREKARLGLAVLVREGSASKNLEALVKGIVADNFSTTNMAFCTDDKHLADIRREGTIRHCIRKAVALGLPLMQALSMATINAARIMGLPKLGALLPGWQADVLVVDDLKELRPCHVFHKGQEALGLDYTLVEPGEALQGSVQVASFDEATFAVEQFLPGRDYPVIEILPGEIVTKRGQVVGENVAGLLDSGELCMIAVLERHHATGHVGIGLLRGYGLTRGAVATTVAHDSHNLIVAGTNARDMYVAAQEIIRVQGGYTLVTQGRVVDTLPLNICGLMSSAPPEQLIPHLEAISQKAWNLGVSQAIDAFITLSFMALPVIPQIRITDMGMFDVEKFTFIK